MKISLQRPYIFLYRFDVLRLSEIFLDSYTLSENSNLELPGYNLVSNDHPSNSKRGGAYI